MHPLIKARVERYESWITDIKKQESFCQEFDKIEEELKGIKGFEGVGVELYGNSVSVNVHVSHTKYISKLLKPFVEHFGKIKRRDIKPEQKCFDFYFSSLSNKVNVYFILYGDACKLVKVGEETKTVDVMELHCSNDEEVVIEE